jgi:RNA polymerase II-associated factor 1
MGMSVKNLPQILNLLDLTVEQQIERIEKSFENAKKARLSTLKHPKFKDLQALELFPIFPDFENWPNPYFLASYDENPITDRLTVGILDLLISQDLPPDDQNMALEETLLKPLQDPENPEEGWLAYFTPTAETLEKIKLKRKLEELGRDVPEEVILDCFVLTL